MHRHCDDHFLFWLLLLGLVVLDASKPDASPPPPEDAGKGCLGCASILLIMLLFVLAGFWALHSADHPIDARQTTVTSAHTYSYAPRAQLVSPEVRRAELVQVQVRRAILVKLPAGGK
jgi:hypothetical protein